MTALLRGERLHCVARPHWIVFVHSVRWLLPGLGVGVVGAALLALGPLPATLRVAAFPLLLLILSIGGGVGGVAWLRWSCQSVLITDVRAIQQSGLLWRRERMVALDRIQDVTVARGVGGRLLGFGDVLVATAGFVVEGGGGAGRPAPALVLARVRGPERVARALFRDGPEDAPPGGAGRCRRW